MTLEDLIGFARAQGASDLHLEAGLPPAFRVRGSLKVSGEPVPAKTLYDYAQDLLGTELWNEFEQRRSCDLSRTINGIRCRINVLRSSRGVGFAIRLLSSFEATVEKLNLHPDIKRFTNHSNGLVLVSGPTGSGKSSTLAALLQEINLTEARHILTIESPIEYTFRPRRAYIRQREVGRDTPSFEQALLDALREDPDVLMVGEMREPETMRLTLNASETGHLVLATVHSSTCVEAVQRVISAFPAEIQSSVAAQLADCLVGVICQRLQFRPDLNMRVPECEILLSTNPVKHFIRSRDFFKIASVIETGADHGMWTFQRYKNWMDRRSEWSMPDSSGEYPVSEPSESQSIPAFSAPTTSTPIVQRETKKGTGPATVAQPSQSGRIEIEPVEGGIEQLLKKLK